jgi:membrane-bound metal-dependent hydrolase YbcI (DUF457 family)
VQLLGVSGAVMIAILACGFAATLLSNWLVAGRTGSKLLEATSFASVVADLVWVFLLSVSGLFAVRYAERILPTGYLGLGFVGYGVLAAILSLWRAALHRRVRAEREHRGDDQKGAHLVRSLLYLLLASVAYLLICWLSKNRAIPILFLPLAVGTLLPDLDSTRSPLGRLFSPLSQWLETRLGAGQQWHSIAGLGTVALVTAPFILVAGPVAWLLVLLGFAAHLALDLTLPQGLALFWPLTHKRYHILRRSRDLPGDPFERRLALALAAATGLLLVIVDVGPPPAPPPPVLTFEQSIERYLALRGRYLAFADVEGTWQATGRRIVARYEILNISERSLVLHDRYTGQVFLAGRGATDNLYLNRITVLAGDAVRIKPVEVRLQHETLGRLLPILYEMQSEPGLQHIFVSGDLVISGSQPASEWGLTHDYAQTSLRRVEAFCDGHVTLRYLTAGKIIEVSSVPVETGGLVIVATYVIPAMGPTVTPLPTAAPAEAISTLSLERGS